MLILKTSHKIDKRLPKLLDVLVGLRQVIRKINFRIAQATKLVHGELKAILIPVDESLHLDEIIGVKGIQNLFNVVPHLGLKLSGTVAEDKRKIRLAAFLGLYLLRHHDEA